MNYQDFIAYELKDVENILMQNNICYEIIYLESNKKNYDKLLVTNIKTKKDTVLLYVDKFLIQI